MGILRAAPDHQGVRSGSFPRVLAGQTGSRRLRLAQSGGEHLACTLMVHTVSHTSSARCFVQVSAVRAVRGQCDSTAQSRAHTYDAPCGACSLWPVDPIGGTGVGTAIQRTLFSATAPCRRGRLHQSWGVSRCHFVSLHREGDPSSLVLLLSRSPRSGGSLPCTRLHNRPRRGPGCPRSTRTLTARHNNAPCGS